MASNNGSLTREYVLDVSVGELAPGHPLVVRRLLLEEQNLTLEYAWVPGITAEEWQARSVYLTIEYGSDGSPVIGDYAGCYDEPVGGPRTEGELIFRRPSADAQHVWFDFFAVSEDETQGRVSRLTVDLTSGWHHVEKR